MQNLAARANQMRQEAWAAKGRLQQARQALKVAQLDLDAARSQRVVYAPRGGNVYVAQR